METFFLMLEKPFVKLHMMHSYPPFFPEDFQCVACCLPPPRVEHWIATGRQKLQLYACIALTTAFWHVITTFAQIKGDSLDCNKAYFFLATLHMRLP